MDTQKWMLFAISTTVFFAITAAAANTLSPNTPLYTFRMEQVSSEMNFLPTEKNDFNYTAENGCTLNYAIQASSAVSIITTSGTCRECRNITNLRTCPKTCETCPGDFGCKKTWDTCHTHCPITCLPTCPGIKTCADTCKKTCPGKIGCEKTWDTCHITCPITCSPTCFWNRTCTYTCEKTCPESHTCQPTQCLEKCEGTFRVFTCITCFTCPDSFTCGVTCFTCPYNYTCEASCVTCSENHTCWDTCGKDCKEKIPTMMEYTCVLGTCAVWCE